MNRQQRSLWLSLLVLALVVGWFGVRAYRDAAAATAAESRLFADVDRVLDLGDRDAPELSALVAALQRLESTDPEVALRRARVELLRGRFESAAELLEPMSARAPAAPLQRAAAEAWLGLHAAGGGSGVDRAALLPRAQQAAEDAFLQAGEVHDLFLAWTAALRIPDAEAVQRLGERLQQGGMGSLAARTAAAIGTSGDLAQSVAPIEALCAEWPTPPAELRTMLGVLWLQQGAVQRAVAELDQVVMLAPNLVEVRNFAAAAHHVAGLALPAGRERTRHLAVRDEHIRWLDVNTESDDGRRANWLQMRQSR